MSIYSLQKLIWHVNSRMDARKQYFADPGGFMDAYLLSPAEREALLKFDVGRLYALGVHGLLLRPFTILHRLSEPDYLKAIRAS